MDSQFYLGFSAGVLTAGAVMLYLKSRPPYSDSEIERRGEKVFHEVAQQGRLEDKLGGFIAIDPQTKKYLFGNTFLQATKQGKEQWQHVRFYVRPVRDERIPHF